jgi:hypothetical protein
MTNKSKKRWLDIQLILASLAVTSTVALWNVFAKPARPEASPTGAPPLDPSFTLTYTPNPTATATVTVAATQDPSAVIHLPKVHILLGGRLPVAPVVAAVAPSDSSGSQSSNNSSGSKSSVASTSTTKTTASNPPPAPVTNTGSSKPKP